MGIRQKEGYPPFLNRENYVYPTNEGKPEPGGLLSFTGGTISLQTKEMCNTNIRKRLKSDNFSTHLLTVLTKSDITVSETQKTFCKELIWQY